MNANDFKELRNFDATFLRTSADAELFEQQANSHGDG
jgi:hypothetical protein